MQDDHVADLEPDLARALGKALAVPADRQHVDAGAIEQASSCAVIPAGWSCGR
jgi:hypothetical protein